MASLVDRGGRLLRDAVRGVITTIAWLLADWFDWRAGLAVCPPMLRDRVAIVTGAKSGLGLETTKALLQQGATVIMACRSLEKANTARDEILSDPDNHGEVGGAEGRLKVMRLDVEDFHSIRRFVADFHKLGLPGLHVLVNNAGVHLMPYKHVDCGFERNIAANYFGPFYLTQLLLDDLKASAPDRVVNVASVGEAMGLLYMRSIPWDDLRGRTLPDSGERAYALSKSYMLMANRELARRLEGTGVDVIAVHPGVSDSSWYHKADKQSYTFSWVIDRVRSVAPFLGVGQPTRSGAISSIYASIEPGLTGISSSPTPHGLIDSLNRQLFGGRLIYYGPAYLANILAGPINFFNTSRCLPVNPWCYSSAACKRLYEMSLDLVSEVGRETGQVERETGHQPATQKLPQIGAAPTVNSNVSSEAANGAASVPYDEGVHGALKQRQQAAAASTAPMGVGDVHTLLAAEALPLKGA